MSPELTGNCSKVSLETLATGQQVGRFTALTAIAGVNHCFTTAIGPLGNLANTLPDWQQTRNKLADVVSAKTVAYPQQVHSNRVVRADQCIAGQPPQADAVITNEKSVALLCISADCPVVLLADTQSNAIAAIHSGWRGTAASIVKATVGELESIYGCHAVNLVAAISPSALGCCYEVGPEVIEQLAESIDDDKLNVCCTSSTTNSEKYMLNLPALISRQLTDCGISVHNIHSSGICTICDDRFHSYRRDGEMAGRCGSIISR